MTDGNNTRIDFPRLNLPPAELRFSRGSGVLKIFDSLRKKYVVLTPEEYVRQNFTAWLRSCLNYPSSLMANEIGIDLNGMRKRCDTVIFNSDGSPLMIIEYKAPNVVISQQVFDQIVRYNMVLKASYLTVTNGLDHYCCRVDYSERSYRFIPQVPEYSMIKKIKQI